MTSATEKRGRPEYTVSKDEESGMWYAHMVGYPYVPVFGSFRKRKSDAFKIAKRQELFYD